MSNITTKVVGYTFNPNTKSARAENTIYLIREDITMARMKNNFKVTREQVELIIKALGDAECWKMKMANNNPEFYKSFSDSVNQYIDLESELRSMIGN